MIHFSRDEGLLATAADAGAAAPGQLHSLLVGLIQYGALIVAGKGLFTDTQLHRLMGASHRENGAAKALLPDAIRSHAECGQSGGRIGHKPVRTADKYLTPDQPLDLGQMIIAQPPFEPLPVSIRLAQDQGQLHACLAQGVQLGGGRYVCFAAAQMHKVHILELAAQGQGTGDGEHGSHARAGREQQQAALGAEVKLASWCGRQQGIPHPQLVVQPGGDAPFTQALDADAVALRQIRA